MPAGEGGEGISHFGAEVLVLLALDRFLIQLDASGSLFALTVAAVRLARHAFHEGARTKFEAKVGLSAVDALALRGRPIGCASRCPCCCHAA